MKFRIKWFDILKWLDIEFKIFMYKTSGINIDFEMITENKRQRTKKTEIEQSRTSRNKKL